MYNEINPKNILPKKEVLLINIIIQGAKKKQTVVKYANKIGSHLFITQKFLTSYFLKIIDFS